MTSFWHAKFDYNVVTPEGRRLETLHDAADYITGLPEHLAGAERWQLATKELLRASTDAFWIQFARSAMISALHPEFDKQMRIGIVTRRQKAEQFRQRRAAFIAEKRRSRSK